MATNQALIDSTFYLMRANSIEWAAGLFEGEGCISWKRCPGGQFSKRLLVTMTDKDVVSRFAEIVGLPEIYPHQTTQTRKDGSPKKPAWVWRTGKESEIRRILAMLLPYFGNRRAYTALNVLDSIELRENS